MVSGLSARFTSGSSADDQARVAKFDVYANSTNSETFDFTDFKPGDTKENIIQVDLTNKSEVAVRYEFLFEMSGDIPLTLRAKEDLTQSSQDGSSCWSTTEPANSNSEKTYKFDLIWPEDENSYAYNPGVASITVTVKAVQED
jgi:hypothetical protein